MPLSNAPRLGDWLLEQVPLTIEPTVVRTCHFRLWVNGTRATTALERTFETQEDAEWALRRRAQRDRVDAWRVQDRHRVMALDEPLAVRAVRGLEVERAYLALQAEGCASEV